MLEFKKKRNIEPKQIWSSLASLISAPENVVSGAILILVLVQVKNCRIVIRTVNENSKRIYSVKEFSNQQDRKLMFPALLIAISVSDVHTSDISEFGRRQEAGQLKLSLRLESSLKTHERFWSVSISITAVSFLNEICDANLPFLHRNTSRNRLYSKNTNKKVKNICNTY